ncbi:MAG: hypothetical protein L0Z50_42620 [Verrucomicrobiales bacterium]|nr:hypothetical protein [Verrucomicrobiales bacterium]
MTLQFEHELIELKEKLLIMASHAETAVTTAVKAVIERDDDLARRVKEDDSTIDRFEIEIDDMAIRLLAKAPLASDLRLITVAMKISQDLERVGDEATTIARRSLELSHEPQHRSLHVTRCAGRVCQSESRQGPAPWFPATRKSISSTSNSIVSWSASWWKSRTRSRVAST